MIVSFDTETRQIPGLPGYEISSDGLVLISHKRGKPRRLNPWPHPQSGTPWVNLSGPDGPKKYFVSRLVLLAWEGPPPEDKPWALHRNGDNSDNRIENLYWGDKKDNRKDAYRHGTAVMPHTPGEKQGGSVLIEEQVLEIRARDERGESKKKICEDYPCSLATIYDVCARRSWRHV